MLLASLSYPAPAQLEPLAFGNPAAMATTPLDQGVGYGIVLGLGALFALGMCLPLSDDVLSLRSQPSSAVYLLYLHLTHGPASQA